jgi:hypothetical protein
MSIPTDFKLKLHQVASQLLVYRLSISKINLESLNILPDLKKYLAFGAVAVLRIYGAPQ